jgi:sigma-B regulation protein RsbU (phosphoserine phosphatase)
MLSSQGFPLAMFPGGEYGQGTLRMGPGDLMFLYTDGITEAADPDGVEFDIDIIAGILRELGPVPLEELHRGLNEALLRHTRGAPLADDQTLILVRRTDLSAALTGVPSEPPATAPEDTREQL